VEQLVRPRIKKVLLWRVKNTRNLTDSGILDIDQWQMDKMKIEFRDAQHSKILVKSMVRSIWPGLFN
jgi:predicted phage gp36 major capsid-like protein